MSLPPGVKLLDEGVAKYYSQRVTRPPMADCMFAALCTPLSFMGYGIPESFVGELRKASGVPLFDARGKGQGTSTAASRKALKKLLPDAAVKIKIGGLDDEVMLKKLRAGEIAVRVVVDCRKLPPGGLRRYIGSFRGLHAVALGGARNRASDGQWEVRWMDPAGPRKNYDGRWVRYARVKGALKRTDTKKVAVTFGEKNAALPSKAPPKPRLDATDATDATDAASASSAVSEKERKVKILTRGRAAEFARIKKGTPFLHPETMERVTRAGDDADFRLAGRSLDGKFTGVWVSTSKVKGASGHTLLLADVSQIGEPFIRR